MKDGRVTVGDLMDDPVWGPRLELSIKKIELEYDMKSLAIYQRRGDPAPKALWKRIIKNRKYIRENS